MTSIDELCFKECEVTQFNAFNNNILIELEDVTYKDKMWARVRVTIFNVLSVSMDNGVDKPFFNWSVKMEAENGKVLVMEIDNRKVFLLIIWINAGDSFPFTQSYSIWGKTVTIEVLSIYQPEC